MVEKAKENTEEMYRVEQVVSTLLRIGVVFSGAIICIGLLLFFITGKSGYPGDTYPTTLSAIFSGLLSFKSFAIMMFGLLCLILTPVLRVIVSIVTFAIEKDYLYVGITTLVFIILIISFIIGIKG